MTRGRADEAGPPILKIEAGFWVFGHEYLQIAENGRRIFQMFGQ
jgi:hypothetical protein